MKKGKKVAVIGAGIAGLACAYELQKKGYDVTVFEKESLAGGRMRSEKKDGLVFDSGADFFADNYTQMKTYAAEFGIPWVATEEHGKHRVIKNGTPHAYDLGGPLDVLRFTVLPFWTRLRFLKWLATLKMNAVTPSFFDLSQLPDSLDFDNAGHFLTTHVGKEVTDYVADPFTGIMQFHGSHEISTAALWALIKMMITPSLHFRIRYTRGGMDAIPTAIARRLNIVYGARIERVSRTPEGVRLTRAGHNELYDAINIATPAPVAARLISNPTSVEQELFARVKYAVTITVAFSMPLDTFRDNTHITYVPFVENSVISGYTNESRKGADSIGNNRTLLNIYLHEGAARALMQETDTRIFDDVFAELQKVSPEIRARSNETRPHALRRWKLAMPKFDHGYVPLVRNFCLHNNGQGNLYLSGDYLNAPWTEGAARCGIRTALEIDSRLNSGNKH